MYSKDEGVFSAGIYVVGSDIEIGRYLLETRENQSGYFALYASYDDFLKHKIAQNGSFQGNFFISLPKEEIVLEITKCSMKKV